MILSLLEVTAVVMAVLLLVVEVEAGEEVETGETELTLEFSFNCSLRFSSSFACCFSIAFAAKSSRSLPSRARSLSSSDWLMLAAVLLFLAMVDDFDEGDLYGDLLGDL